MAELTQKRWRTTVVVDLWTDEPLAGEQEQYLRDRVRKVTEDMDTDVINVVQVQCVLSSR